MTDAVGASLLAAVAPKAIPGRVYNIGSGGCKLEPSIHRAITGLGYRPKYDSSAGEWWSNISAQKKVKDKSMTTTTKLDIKIFADGADRDGIIEMYNNPQIAGFTTNPTLMRKAGISDYRAFALDILKEISDRPISFEVFSDELPEMERQAMEIASWGENVYVKIPVTNTGGETCYELARKLSASGVKVNVTAMMLLDQVRRVGEAVEGGAPCCVSVFAGRVADTGRDPVPMMAAAVELLRPYPNAELIWASPRELLNVFQADAIGCHIITVTNDVLKKLSLVDKDLRQYSLETVQMFHADAQSAGFEL